MSTRFTQPVCLSRAVAALGFVCFVVRGSEAEVLLLNYTQLQCYANVLILYCYSTVKTVDLIDNGFDKK